METMMSNSDLQKAIDALSHHLQYSQMDDMKAIEKQMRHLIDIQKARAGMVLNEEDVEPYAIGRVVSESIGVPPM